MPQGTKVMTLKHTTAILWLLLSALLLASGYLMLRACGLSLGPWSVSWCPINITSPAQESIASLLGQIETLEKQLLQPLQCPAPVKQAEKTEPPPPPVTHPVEPAPPPPVVPAPTPKVEPTQPSEPPPTQPEEPRRPQIGENLRMPTDRKDLSFLEGCWMSISPIKNARTGTPIQIRYCFQNNGRGQVDISQSNGVHCAAPLSAQRNGNTVKIQHGAVPCSDGSGFLESIITCKPKSGEASCDILNYRNGLETSHRVPDGRFKRVE